MARLANTELSACVYATWGRNGKRNVKRRPDHRSAYLYHRGTLDRKRHTTSSGDSQIGIQASLIERDAQMRCENDVANQPGEKISPRMGEYRWPQRFAELCHDAKN